jgi:hypothetical protein
MRDTVAGYLVKYACRGMASQAIELSGSNRQYHPFLSLSFHGHTVQSTQVESYVHA